MFHINNENEKLSFDFSQILLYFAGCMYAVLVTVRFFFVSKGILSIIWLKSENWFDRQRFSNRNSSLQLYNLVYGWFFIEVVKDSTC